MKDIELIDSKFKKKLDETKKEIYEYFKDKRIDVNNLLPLNEILEHNNFNGVNKIYVSNKFPEEYTGIVTDIIKKNFPN
ncbi:hypothetical protein [Empedobacter falsenii]